ncbi:hypothetical protein [Microcoleus sp. Pol10D4]|uniref:hypothetical protein n=1 Tax=Microcoleus sp. Pol10D4 TaxID=3055387 RepID=UPI002FD3FE67
MLVPVVDEASSQRNIRVVTDASEEWTTEKVEVVVKKCSENLACWLFLPKSYLIDSWLR